MALNKYFKLKKKIENLKAINFLNCAPKTVFRLRLSLSYITMRRTRGKQLSNEIHQYYLLNWMGLRVKHFEILFLTILLFDSAANKDTKLSQCLSLSMSMSSSYLEASSREKESERERERAREDGITSVKCINAIIIVVVGGKKGRKKSSFLFSWN